MKTEDVFSHSIITDKLPTLSYKTVQPVFKIRSFSDNVLIGEGTYGKVYRCKLIDDLCGHVTEDKWTDRY